MNKKKATLQVEFEFKWSDEDDANYFADESHFAELYLASVLGQSGFKGMFEADVTCIKVEDVE